MTSPARLMVLTLLTACIAGTEAAEQAPPLAPLVAPLLSPLQNQDRVPGCAWLASAPALGEGYMFMADYDDSVAWMNVNGNDIPLNFVEEQGSRLRVGDVLERTYRAPGVDVLARYEVTWVCPADSENCEVTRFGASFEVTTANRIQLVAASGAVGC